MIVNNNNISISTNIFNTKTEIPKDLKGNPCYVEKFITPYKKQGVWNQPLESFNHYTSNVQTVVKENEYEQKSKPNQKLTNFSDKELNNLDDYLDTMLYRQVADYYNDVLSAYEKAQIQTQRKEELLNMLRLSKKGEMLTETVLNNLKKVRDRVREKVYSLNIEAQEKQRRNQAEVQRLYKTMKEAVQHILNGSGEAKFNRMTKTLQEKEHLTCENFKQKRPANDAKESLKFFEDLRLLTSKRTDEFEILRQIHGDDFLTDTTMLKEISDSGKTGDTGSMMSETMTKYESEVEKQQLADPKLAKLYNISELKYKWGYKNDQQVKDSIRRILVRETLSEAEHKKARQEREEQAMRNKMLKNDPNLAYLFKAQDENKKKIWKEVEEKKKQREKEKADRMERLFAKKEDSEDEDDVQNNRGERVKLNPQQIQEKKIKNQYFTLSSNALLSQGEAFDRTKNYSQLFKQRAQNNQATLKYVEDSEKINEYIMATYS